jgi:hypothetical protein
MTEWIGCALSWAETHEGAAAWVQAIFSVIAIAAAFLISHFQHVREVRQARRARIEDRLRTVETIGAIVINAMNLIEQARKGTDDPGRIHDYIKRGYDPSAFDCAETALGEINLASVPDHELVRPIIEIRNLLREAKALPPAIQQADNSHTAMVLTGQIPKGSASSRAATLRGSLRRVREEAHQHTTNVEAAVNRVRDELGK